MCDESAQNNLQAFESEYGEGYQLLERGEGWATLRFLGRLEGEAVLWQATVETLAYRCRHCNKTELRNSIEIEPQSNNTATLRLGLAVDRIDHPVLLMAMKMVRQYKNLKAGLHEYGPSRHC